jgi:non-heme chloroperoxidase
LSSVGECTGRWRRRATVDTVRNAILDDRPAWLTGLIADFLNLDDYLGKRVSEETVRNTWNAGAEASPWATWACVPTWLEDFHEDIKRIDIPTLILHGTADRILSLDGQDGACTRRSRTRATSRSTAART